MTKKQKTFFYTMATIALLFAHVWRSFLYEERVRELGALEEQQKAIIEQNKRIAMSIAIFSSPQRIDKLAREGLGLRKIDPARVTRLTLPNEEKVLSK